MKKLTKGESNIIKEGLELYMEAWLKQINQVTKRGGRPLFTEGYVKQLMHEIACNVDQLTKVTK